ncbi:hypothetical protein M3M39_02790 [Fructilactobacillus hinvesii]|uniref:Uncharacterized protein n=1 Tax=Fructilactobacillus hinvesii TaxID=2940300 RepID=A0ABY5BUA4_9LACO|nr:hypothetical protein [Fructilactobacillus hinvesii]USS88424.1 hypothetical protein M3M39_02790 [Fructilactobacillus hinvesii]
MSDNLSFSELNDAAKDKALTDFVPFYVSLLRNEELDVMASFDFNHVIADINRTIMDVNNQLPEEIYAFSAQFNRKDYENLLEQLPQTFFDNGNPNTDWREWYVEETNKLDPFATL